MPQSNIPIKMVGKLTHGNIADEVHTAILLIKYTTCPWSVDTHGQVDYSLIQFMLIQKTKYFEKLNGLHGSFLWIV
jgi:hypothetical protein